MLVRGIPGLWNRFKYLHELNNRNKISPYQSTNRKPSSNHGNAECMLMEWMDQGCQGTVYVDIQYWITTVDTSFATKKGAKAEEKISPNDQNKVTDTRKTNIRINWLKATFYGPPLHTNIWTCIPLSLCDTKSIFFW